MDFTADEYARRDADRLRHVLWGPPVTWVFVGDSITQGVTHTRGWRSYVEHFAERVRGELGRRADAVVNTGVAAATAEGVLPEFHWRVGRFGPDVVAVMFGSNDANEGLDGIRSYRYALDQLVQRSRDVGATVVLQTPPPVQSGGRPAPDVVAAYAEEVRSLAAHLGVVLVDHHARWTQAGADGGPQLWFDDLVHPSAAGHLELARTLFDTLGIADARSGVCALQVAAQPAG
ncbi:MAG TPA: SGNH/GDSL hydrolase family protein [Intrasporangium sp.]|uniref:SGNH/GDSL hydrolase family protein n=1 Tax=Intrasporangium sp. TaxID=1925024 RepID=UPI002D781FF7|nr:SGNH/GDSL hydrolase family protein [Intrasporangium sp.]HET7399990.1 SGNH/GDSL hydrolase family protein [Intrasporangium sp.]